MESIESPLSRKTRGILYTLAKTLKENKTTVQEAVYKVFSFAKEKFKLGELTQLVKSIDPRLPYNEIDVLGNELDPEGNGFIFFQELRRRLEAVRPDDDPFRNDLDNQSVEILSKSRMAFKLSDQEEELLALKQFKDAISQSDPYQLLDIFDQDRDGCLGEGEFSTMLFNVNFTDKKAADLVRRRIFGGKAKVKFAEVLKALGIEDIAQRVSFDDIDNKQSFMHSSKRLSPPKHIPEPRPEPPKNTQPRGNSSPKKVEVPPPKRDSPKKEVAPLKKEHSPSTDQAVILEVPQVLQTYYNPSSELTEPLASLALAHLLQASTFYDKDNPKIKAGAQYAHILHVFGGDYYLWQNSSSAILRDRRGLGALMEARNILQGGVGDCYFMSAIAGVTEHYPQLIYRLFVLDRNPASIYGIRLFIDGCWATVILDACFPVNTFGHFIYAKPHNHVIWVMLLEKAWAKVYGSYEAINAGYAHEGLVALTGAPCEAFMSEDDGTIDRLRIYLKKGYIVSCSSSDMIEQMSERDQERVGIFSGHAYTVLRIESDLPWKDRKVTLLKVRNPWGNKEWKGDWSFSSPKWTPELRKRLNYQRNPNDGSFYMSLEDYMVYFSRITVCFVSLGKTHGHIALSTDRSHSAMVSFSVKTEGDYFFSIYQESRRKYKQSANYKLSKSRLFLAKYTGGKVEAVASKACISENLNLQTTLTPGDYVLSCKVKWNYHERSTFTLTSYGAQAVQFKPIPKIQGFLQDFIESKATFELGQKTSYAKLGLHSSYKIIYMDPKQGFGYILVRNNSDRLLESTIRFGKIFGIKPVKPVTLPLRLVVVPHSSVVRGFLIDPSGYGYEISEQFGVS